MAAARWARNAQAGGVGEVVEDGVEVVEAGAWGWG